MKSARPHRISAALSALVLALGLLAPLLGQAAEKSKPVAPAGVTATADLAALDKRVPDSLADLRVIEREVKAVTRRVQPSVVGVKIGNARGSGVIVTEDGYVLTAAHVCGRPDRRVTLQLSDGREVKGKTLGVYRTLDAGLIQITDKGEWPHAEMAKEMKLDAGDWVVAAGHPGGYRSDRPAVIRLGRVIRALTNVVQTDCTLVGGDSGGPLFNLRGEVVGINSRIGASTTWNFHVPVAQYAENWDRLVAGEMWGGRDSGARIGIHGRDHENGCEVTGISPGYPAENVGLKVGDVIVRFEGRRVRGIQDLATRVGDLKPGDEVTLEVLRGEETLEFKVELGDSRKESP